MNSGPSPHGPAIVTGIDRAAFAVAFGVRLRERGLAVGFTALELFTRALAAGRLDSRAFVYWAARISLVAGHADIEDFDAVFEAAFDAATLDVDPHARRRPLAGAGHDEMFTSVPAKSSPAESGGGVPWATLPRVVGPGPDDAGPLVVPQRLPGSEAGLADKPFEDLDPADMELLGGWLMEAVARWPTRRTRRVRVHPRGQRIALRQTIAASRRTGWEAITPTMVRPVDKPRRVVMLCDVSESMQAQATAYLHLMRGLALLGDAEVFAFSTTMVRLTAVLSHRSDRAAIDQATLQVTDRFGGTRIATSIKGLLASRHGGATRGAIVIIASDAWDSDPPEQLSRQMARLRRHAHRVIWINPRLSAPGFEPRVGALAAALPHCDALLPADTFLSLRLVVDHIAQTRLPAARSVRPSAVSSTR